MCISGSGIRVISVGVIKTHLYERMVLEDLTEVSAETKPLLCRRRIMPAISTTRDAGTMPTTMMHHQPVVPPEEAVPRPQPEVEEQVRVAAPPPRHSRERVNEEPGETVMMNRSMEAENPVTTVTTADRRLHLCQCEAEEQTQNQSDEPGGLTRRLCTHVFRFIGLR